MAANIVMAMIPLYSGYNIDLDDDGSGSGYNEGEGAAAIVVVTGNAGIPHSSTMAGSVNRGFNNQMYSEPTPNGGSRIVDSISNQMYSAPTPNGGFKRSCSVKSSGVLYAIPIEDAETYVGANHSGAPSEA
eukprot:gene15332-13988_t